MMSANPRHAALLVAIAAGAALAVALGSEHFEGLVPCALCLLERWPYRIAIGLGILGMLLPRRAGIVVLSLALLTILGAAVLAFVHVGVEQGYWPSPLPECAAPTFSAGSIAERLASMPARPSKPCDDPTYLVPGLPVSMAAMNLIYALALCAVLAIYLLRNAGGRR